MDEVHIGHATLRPKADGTLDEVFIADGQGRVLLHLEQMDDGCFWGRTEAGVVFWFRATKGGRISLRWQDEREKQPVPPPDNKPTCALCRKRIKGRVYYQAGQATHPVHKGCRIVIGER